LSRRPSLWSALAVAAVALGSGAGFADPPAKSTEPDEEFLEFLGTVDSTADANTPADDQSWIDYLSRTDIERAAQGKAAKKSSAPEQPPGASAPGQVPGAKSPTAPAAQGTGTKPGAPKVKSDGQ